MRRSVAVLATTLTLALLPACGGDDGDEPADDGGDTLSRADFIEQGDGICSGLDADVEQLEAPTDEAAFGDYIREVIALGRDARDRFAALQPPSDGEQVQAALLDSIDSSLEAAEGAAQAADDGDTVTAGDLLAEADAASADNDRLAADYGFQECGTDDDGESDPAAEPDAGAGGELSKEEFIAQGDAVCQELAAATASIAEPVDESDLGRFIQEVLVLGEGAREQFAALTPPEDGVAVQQELLASLDASLEAGAGAVAAAEQGDTVTAGDLLAEAAAAGGSADASAQAYGFTVCGSEDEG